MAKYGGYVIKAPTTTVKTCPQCGSGHRYDNDGGFCGIDCKSKHDARVPPRKPLKPRVTDFRLST